MNLRIGHVVTLALWFLAPPLAGMAGTTRTVAGYARRIPAETQSARVSRHARVAERRSGTVLIAHRGATTMATENTLEAYAAAMDYGADGCEVDVRRTADGILVLFHDDMLDRLTDGFGWVEDLAYAELLTLQPQLVRGTATRRTRPPTFAALLILARQRAMLLHLDVKTEGLDEDITRMLDEADLWDHVVSVNPGTVPRLIAHPKLKLLPYKVAVYEDRLDADPASVKAALAKPGQMLILEDPRVAARELHRVPHRPVPLSGEVFARWPVTPVTAPPNGTNFVAAEIIRRVRERTDPDSTRQLLSLLSAEDSAEHRSRAGGAEHIVERAWAAERLGRIGRKSRPVVEALEFQVRHPSLHPDWLVNTLDGHAAARALGRLNATESAPVLIAAFRRVDPDLARVRNPLWTNTPLAWVDWRKGMIISALGELRSKTAEDFLWEYVTMNEAGARELAIPQFEDATRALLRRRLTRGELSRLLQSANQAVRGTAILECVDHPTRERTAALRESAPWALTLPRAQR